MKDNVKKDNRKALPKFLLVLLGSGILGAFLGFGVGVARAVGMPELMTDWMNAFWRTVSPWGIPVSSAVLLGAALVQYRAAKASFAAWDGEEEHVIEQAEEKLNWALLWSTVTIVLDFLFMAAGNIYLRGSNYDMVVVGCFLLSAALTILLQQKVVDLTRRMNPEKQGSVYDMKFKKKWLESCDEAEQRQIGQAAFTAYHVTSTVCIFAWLVLEVLNFVFDFGLMPIFVLMVIWGVLQVSYAVESIRLSRPKH